MDNIYRRLGKRVRKERQQLGWTQEDLAERCGMHPSYVGQVERGVKKISIASLEKLARALRVPPGSLLDDSSAPAPDSWGYKFEGLLRDKPEKDRRLLYSTLRHLSKEIRRNK